MVENSRPTTPIEKKNYYQASVEFECLDGFYLSGQSRASCGADSTWLPGLPTCTKVATTAVVGILVYKYLQKSQKGETAASAKYSPTAEEPSP